MRSFKKRSGEIMPLGVPQKQRENALKGVEQATHTTFENVLCKFHPITVKLFVNVRE